MSRASVKRYDLIVIGGGAAGLTVAAGAANFGAKVALIEREKELGGDCLHYGCIPSKALIETAKQIAAARKTIEEFKLGVELEETLPVDFSLVRQRIEAAISQIQEHDSKERFESLGVELFHGEASFRDTHMLTTDHGEQLLGKRIIIATGSSPNIPSIPGLEEVPYQTNETIFRIKQLPKHLVVLGGGAIGVELGQAFAKLGSQVTLIESSTTILAQEDPDIVQVLQANLQKEINILTQTKVSRVEYTTEQQIKLVVERAGKQEEILADELLVAAGRKPNLAQLNLEQVGVQVNERGIVVNSYLQTNIPHIYALGDIIGSFPFTHAAGMEGKVALANALFGLRKKVSYAHFPWVIFTDPEVFHLGLTEQEAKDKYGDSIRVYTTATTQVDRFIAAGKGPGVVKVITTKKGKILGAHAAADQAGEWMQEFVLAKQTGRKLADLSTVLHPYPTHSQAVSQTADLYWRERLFAGWLPELMKKYVRWFR